MYVLPGSASPLEFVENSDNQETVFPSVFDVIRKSNGITVYADLGNIEITRINSISNGGGRIKTEINLLNALNLQDISQNIRLFDNDTIMIPRTDTPATKQISKAIKSNLNPSFINIFIGGNVNTPGVVKVSKTSTLNEALIIGGGTTVLKGPAVFLRYLNNGDIDRRKFRLNNSAERGSFVNPFLKDGDVIFLDRSKFSVATEVLGEVTAPFQGIFSTWGFFKLIF
tara:strand:- start:68 stop:748 length:681 start_codon:yes stop_codon:yes gene_type:complete